MIIVTIAGFVGADAEVRKAGDGDVMSFRMAADEDTKERASHWFEVSAWGAYGVAIADYIKKGDPITVCGSLVEEEYQGKIYKKVKNAKVALMGGGGGKGERGGDREERGGRDSRRDERGGREERSSRDDRGGRDDRSSRSSRDDRDTRAGRGGSRHEDDIPF